MLDPIKLNNSHSEYVMSARNLSEVPHTLKKHLASDWGKKKSKNPDFFFFLSKAEDLNPYKHKDKFPGFQLKLGQATHAGSGYIYCFHFDALQI